MAKPILVFVVAAIIVWTTAILFAQEQVAVPSFKEGDTWQFNISRKGQIASSTDQIEGMYEVSVTQGVVKLYEVDGGQKNEILIPPDGSAQTFLRLVGKSDERPTLKFPLSLGQKWTYEYVTRPTGNRFKHRRSVEVNVVGIEQVTTPAGIFNVYRLIMNESWWARNGKIAFRAQSSTTTYFYSPETRSIVKSSSLNDHDLATAEIELIKFTPGI
jgi:hypothetical protein